MDNKYWQYFNPLPHKRENGLSSTATLLTINFNPLPRKRENSSERIIPQTLASISIHSLARGRTSCLTLWTMLTRFQSTPSQEGEQAPVRYRYGVYQISIHSLARGRTTILITVSAFHLLFQSTPSQEGERHLQTGVAQL